MPFPSIGNVPFPETRIARWMFTDWVLIARAAQELAELFTRARVREIGQLSDGRFAVILWKAGKEHCLAADVFAPTPLLTLEEDLPAVQEDAGFTRSAAATLTGMQVGEIKARRGDRLIRLRFASRSRFGVTGGASLIFELVPRFGNIILLRDHTIVAALKEFSFAQNGSRQIMTGHDYEPPPLALEPGENVEPLAAALSTSPKEAAKALRRLRPLVPSLIAESLIFRYRKTPGDPADGARQILQSADEVVANFTPEIAGVPLCVYRRDGKLVQAHVVSLEQFADLPRSAAPALLPLLKEARASHASAAQSDTKEKQRRALAHSLEVRERKLTSELRKIEENLGANAEREQLRSQGEKIFATLHELPSSEQSEAKDRAASSFRRYKRLVSSLPHLQERYESVQRSLDAVAQLRWELERAGAGELEDVTEAVAALEPHKRSNVQRTRRRKRKPLAVTTASGSRILVGRSPRENAELTFGVARPDDLWFHAQKIPGAHVILQRDDKQRPSDEDIARAASLAAYHSKGKESLRVTVDYTQRKYVRKQPAAPPGLVFYTNVKSLTVTPSAL